MAQRGGRQMTIGQVAAAVGVAATTLRFYEREGILAPALRSKSGYRLYDESAVERLAFIRSAQAVGFTLEDIRALLQLDARVSCKDVQSVIERRLADVNARLADLRRVRGALSDAMQRCRKSKKGCAILVDLGAHRRKKRAAR